ncbi:MAG TPA: TraB/GumN family protein, partial [Thermoplasmata archaeon]|nr:TraB/GumN family protein [Thermoplasmata archaeon]
GVGHVFDLQSAIRSTIQARRPAIVGVELDPARFQALQTPESRRPSFGVYAILAYVQRRIASEYGTQAGGEMIAAARAASDVGARLAFLDLDSRAVLSRLMRAMSGKERVKFALSILGGLFVRRSTVERELKRFEADEGAFIAELARDFPAVKRVLIDERNVHMAQALRVLEADHGSVLAVVGEGHVEGLRALLADRSPEVVRLRDLRTALPPSGNASVSVSFGP